MSTKKIAIAGTVLAVGAVFAPISAQAYSSGCAADHACIYDNADYVGLLSQRVGNRGVADVTVGQNDRMSSWANKTTYNGAWYWDAGGQGWCEPMASRTEKNYVGWFPNDTLSSWKTNGLC
jgi:hypothetical protein